MSFKERKTPLMGWSSWNAFKTAINEDLLKEQANLLVETGLKDAGYTYLNIDDGYFGGRDENENLKFRGDRFPNGLKPLVDYIHSKNLKAGIYSDGGDSTCASFYDQEGANGKGVGLYEHEERDLNLFFDENDFDFIKVDWCGGLRLGLNEKEQYSKIGSIINALEKKLDKDIVFNVCRWQFPGEWIVDVADSWRTGADITPEFSSVLFQLDAVKNLNQYTGPGHVNDLDMLQVGNGMSKEEDESHFIMWCMMSTPLMIGCDLKTLDQETLELLKNKDLIALNQDPACLQAYVIDNVTDENGILLAETWVKDLGAPYSKEKAFAFLNRYNKPLKIKINLNDIMDAKLTSLKDLINQEELPEDSLEEDIEISLEPHQTKVFKAEFDKQCKAENIDEQFSFTPSPVKLISKKEAEKLLKEDALLVDVRTPDEYETGHLEGSINIPFIEGHSIPLIYPDDKEKAIILYCRSGKRAEEVAQILEYYGYNNVYSLGGILNMK